MKNILFLISFCSFIFNANAQNWQYQATKSKVKWTGKAAFNSYSLDGTLAIKSASIATKNGDITSANFIFDMKSMDGEIKDLIKHLKSKDFFEVKKYKTATFDLTDIAENESGQKIAIGQLSVKAVTQPIRFPISIDTSEQQLIVRGTATVNRTEFGITFNSPSFFEKLKDQAIADDFVLDFELYFTGN